MVRATLILFYFLISSADELQQGIDYFNARATNAKGLQAEETNINKAIQVFEKMLKENENTEVAGAYYLKSLNFKGRFVMINITDKKEIFTKAIAIGNKLIKQFPKSGPIRFELISSIGLQAELNGVLKSIQNDVLKQMLYHAQQLIKTDSMYMTGGGWKVLAIINYKTPAIPLILTWPNKEFAKALLKKSLIYFPTSISNNFYFAEALFENNEKLRAKVYFQLVIKLPPRKDYVLEDEFFKMKAKKYLDKLM